MEVIKVQEIEITIERKAIKHMYLKVRPPTADVLISAPDRTKTETIRNFVVNKLSWIRKQQGKINSRKPEKPCNYVDRESHYLWGEKYPMTIVESAKWNVNLENKTIVLETPSDASFYQKQQMISAWYRQKLKQVIPKLIKKWEPTIGVKVNNFFVQQMKTKWGSCNITAGNIRLNTELAKKPPICLEYVVVHEMTHLLEASHNKRFKALLDKFLPQWREHEQMLDRS